MGLKWDYNNGNWRHVVPNKIERYKDMEKEKKLLGVRLDDETIENIEASKDTDKPTAVYVAELLTKQFSQPSGATDNDTLNRIKPIIGDMGRIFLEGENNAIKISLADVDDKEELINLIHEDKPTFTILDAISRENRSWIEDYLPDIKHPGIKQIVSYLNYLVTRNKKFKPPFENLDADSERLYNILKKLINWKPGEPKINEDDLKYLGSNYPPDAKLRLTKDGLKLYNERMKEYEEMKKRNSQLEAYSSDLTNKLIDFQKIKENYTVAKIFLGIFFIVVIILIMILAGGAGPEKKQALTNQKSGSTISTNSNIKNLAKPKRKAEAPKTETIYVTNGIIHDNNNDNIIQ
jgi:hypothetical protein